MAKLLINIEGFWASDHETHLPTPVGTSWRNRELFLRLLSRVESRVESGVESVQYKGFSWCRMCDKSNGSIEYKLDIGGNVWVWPDGYKHYIHYHQVRPSLAFEEFITAAGEPT